MANSTEAEEPKSDSTRASASAAHYAYSATDEQIQAAAPPANGGQVTSSAHEQNNRPIVLITSHILMGHLSPMLRIASELITRGWEVAFLGPTAHRARIETTGARFIALRGAADLSDREYYAHPPTPDYATLHWSQRVCEDIRHQLIEPLPVAWECFTDTLRILQSSATGTNEASRREIVLLTEAFSWGVLPKFYGAKLPDGIKAALGSVCVSVTVPAIRSIDLPPCGYPFPYDPSPEGRALNAKLWAKSWGKRAQPLTKLLDEKLVEAGAISGCSGEGRPLLSGANYLVHDTILQLGVPGLEYPRSDWPPHLRFIGLAQGKAPTDDDGYRHDVGFPWWTEVVENSSLPVSSPLRKKLLVVSQGTVETNPLDLIIPTLQAYTEQASSVLVVAILGWKEASLEEYRRHFARGELPSNARIADFVNYDTVLQYADVWIHNAGFGAVCHGIANGVPMVCAGEGMDKVDNSRRVAWAGVGVDLQTQRPTADMVRRGVDRILRGDEGARFRDRVMALRQESEELQCFDTVERELMRLAGAGAGTGAGRDVQR